MTNYRNGKNYQKENGAWVETKMGHYILIKMFLTLKSLVYAIMT